ncbi:efflux RND transporter periplasmic adaptor subunit [Bacteroides ihuae]|uniref:efflux RND transporter periplasmic adaptor subunit n=1 Tax=Bacteroides ihuae TaxID=1852362 RepID=UPI0008DB0169|nr:efflux RND transporter periplasmic adaptor subunit [Bacteroides ihuae]
MKHKRILTIAVIALIPIAIIIGLFINKGKLNESEKPVDRSNIAVKVIVDTVSYKTSNNSFSQPATIIADEEGDMGVETSGKITTLNIDLGTIVRKGQVVGHIDVVETQQKLEAAELSINKLSADYERQKVLAAGDATNANAVSDAKYDLDSKKLEAAQLRTQIRHANIIAPINGIVVEKQKIAGEYVSTGTTIATIINTQSLKAEVNVPEDQLSSLKKGQKTVITSDVYPEKTFSGIVNFISPKGDENHNYIVRIDIENNSSVQLKSGLYINVKFPGTSTQQKRLMIQKIALVEGVKNPFVYVYKDGSVEERKLVTGSESGNYIEIRKGLSPGELVVTSGQINLSNGTKATIIKTQ